MDLEIVRPDALKRVILTVNGSAVRVSSLELAKAMLNWPPRSEKPPTELIRRAADDLLSLMLNPPDGYDVREATGPYFSITIMKVKQ